MMHVSNGKHSFWRSSRKLQLKRNGDFVDVWYNDQGVKRWIAIPIAGLEEYLAGNEREADVLGEFDLPADYKTLVDWNMTRAQTLKDEMEAVFCPHDDLEPGLIESELPAIVHRCKKCGDLIRSA
jgi:hypothetical protein